MNIFKKKRLLTLSMNEKLFSFGGHFWICGQLVWGLEPTVGDGCSEDTIASRLDISGSKILGFITHTSSKRTWILYFLKKPSRDSKIPRSAILRLRSITWSPVPTRRTSVLETLVMHSNNRNNVCDASLPRPRLFIWVKHWGLEVVLWR